MLIAVGAGLAFAAGAALVILTVLLAPSDWRSLAVLFAAAGALAVTSAIVGRLGRLPVWRTMLRTVVIGVAAMLLSLLVGTLFDL